MSNAVFSILNQKCVIWVQSVLRSKCGYDKKAIIVLITSDQTPIPRPGCCFIATDRLYNNIIFTGSKWVTSNWTLLGAVQRADSSIGRTGTTRFKFFNTCFRSAKNDPQSFRRIILDHDFTHYAASAST